MIKVYFGTNRKPNRATAPSDFGHGFSRDGLANLRFGMAEVAGADLDEFETYVAPENLRIDRGRKIKGGSDSVLVSCHSSNVG